MASKHLHGDLYLNTKTNKRFRRKKRHVKGGIDVYHDYGHGKKVGYGSHIIPLKGKKKARPKSDNFDPLAPLSGKQFTNELHAATALKYGPGEREIASERRVSDQAGVNTAHWYDQYTREIQAAAAAQQAATQGVQQGVYNQANAMAAGQSAQQQQLAQQAQQQAALRGATPDAGVQLQAQQAIQGQRALSSAFGGMVGAQGAARSGYMNSRRVAAQQEKIGALQDERKRRRQIDKSASDLANEKGQFAQQFRHDTRDSERTYALNQQAFGLNAAKAGETARSNRARERENKRSHNLAAKVNWARIRQTDKTYRLNVRKFGETQARNRYLAHHGLAQERETHRHNVAQENKSGGRGGRGGNRLSGSMTNHEIFSKVLASVKYDNKPDATARAHPRFSRVALYYHKHGYVTRGMARFMRRYGIKLRTHSTPKKKLHGDPLHIFK